MTTMITIDTALYTEEEQQEFIDGWMDAGGVYG